MFQAHLSVFKSQEDTIRKCRWKGINKLFSFFPPLTHLNGYFRVELLRMAFVGESAPFIFKVTESHFSLSISFQKDQNVFRT